MNLSIIQKTRLVPRLLAIFSAMVVVASMQTASADLVSVALGENDANKLDDASIIAGQVIVGGESFITSGAVPAGVSFTITATSTGDGGVPMGQGGGLGVLGGRAGAGLDNNDNNTDGTNPAGAYSEELTFTISGVTGGTVQFSSFAAAFAILDPAEYMNLNGAAAQVVDSLTQYAVSGSTFRVAAAPFSEQAFDSRFVIDELTFDIAAVPEPASVALLGLAGLALVSRRRK